MASRTIRAQSHGIACVCKSAVNGKMDACVSTAHVTTESRTTKGNTMSTAVIVALATAIPAIIGAITALVVALKSNGTAKQATAAIQDHVVNTDKLN